MIFNQWFVLQVRPRQESMTSSLLQHKGYESYVPVYTPRQSRRRHCAEPRQRPVFPGYVFCRFCWEEGLTVQSGGGVVTTPGVVRVIGAGRTPIPIPDEEIESIKLVLGSGLAAEPAPYLRIGQKVEIEAGPLRGVTGIIQSITGNYQLVVSIELLQRSLAVVIHQDWLNPVSLISEALAMSRPNPATVEAHWRMGAGR